MRGKRQSRVKLPIFATVIFGVVGILLLTASAVRVWQTRLWRQASRFTVVVNSDPLTILSLEPQYQQATLLTIPGNTFLEVPFGYGNYLASSIFRLGKLEDKHPAGFLFTRSVENSLGIMIDGYIAKKEGIIVLPIKAEDIKKIKKNYFSYTSLPTVFLKIIKEGGQYETNLSWLDLYRLYLEIKKLRSDKIKLIDMSQSSALTDTKLPDQTRVKIIDNEIFDFVAGDLTDISIRSENVSLEIVNAANMDKLATQVGRILKNLGANVIGKTTLSQTEKFSCLIRVFSKQALNSVLLKRLINHYQCGMEDMTFSKEGSSVDIKLLLGEGFIK